MYGKADGNVALARRLYQERYPQRQFPDRKTFVRLHYRLCEYGQFNSPGLGRGRPRSTTPEVQEEILEAVNMTPSISTRRVALQVNVPHTTVWRLLKEYQLFCQWFLQQYGVNPNFPALVLFTHEAQFTRNGITNFHNQHVWAYENPRATVPTHHQVRFSLNMWVGIIGDRLVGPHVLVNRLTGQVYTNFLENTIPHVLEDTPLINRQHIHFLHDGSLAHFSRTARRYLDRRFPDRWIGRGGPIAWSPRSPDLNPVDFYLWGHLKSLVYLSPVSDLESLRNRIVVCSEDIRNTPGVWDRVRRYDHLSELINKILEEKPENVVDYFEEYSRNLKEERFRPATDRLQDMYVPPGPLESAKKMMNLFEIPPEKEAEVLEEDEPTENIQTDVMETQFYFENGGIGLPRNEMFLIALGMRKLRLNQRFKKIRFWGKILGTEKNYYIVETDLSEEEYERRNQEAERKAEKGDEGEGEEQTEPQLEEPFGSSAVSEEVKDEDVDSGDAKEQQKPLPPIPKSTYKPFPEVPAELSGEGVNKKILTFPAFPGKEKNYLRAQIARISAATQVSPLGFYQFSEEEEEVPEEEEVQLNYVENPDYEPVPLKDLIDPSMSFWVHHTLPILKQGRCEWWNPKTKVGEEGEEEVEEEEEDVEEGEQREVGPVLLTPLSEDATLETVPPWSVRQSSERLPDFAVAVIRSNLWPGAYAYAINRSLQENLGKAQDQLAAAEETLVYHIMNHNQSFRSIDCTSDLPGETVDLQYEYVMKTLAGNSVTDKLVALTADNANTLKEKAKTIYTPKSKKQLNIMC
ncbi:hypothetical protein ANN_04251 [Periplaneta americana]|uniref:DUF4817 domain-containing protein n=1 Tax=Periplaneta americana TaxID=6978 RepID=A0ABQ8T819_PERAM|nr:hypothetical protein ANN_04251 [Periplaneta americana]